MGSRLVSTLNRGQEDSIVGGEPRTLSTVVAIFAVYFSLRSGNGCAPFASDFVLMLSNVVFACLTSKLLFWWVESLRMEFWRRGKKFWWGKRTGHAKLKITTQIGSPDQPLKEAARAYPRSASINIRYQRRIALVNNLACTLLERGREKEKEREIRGIIVT